MASSTPLPDPTHRKRELPQNELEATSQLKLGEFQTVPTLSLSEARLVINKVLDLRRKGEHKFEEREYVYPFGWTLSSPDGFFSTTCSTSS